MTVFHFRLPALLFGMLLLFAACDKDDIADLDPTNTDDNTPTANQPDNPTPTFTDSDGALVAIQTVSYISQPVVGVIETTIGLAVAAFPDGSGGNNAAGAITCEGESLTQNSNNSYTYMIDANNATGISFSSTVDWTVAGSGSIPAITKSVSGVFPSSLESGTASGSDVSTGSAFTLSTTNPVSDADSLIFAVHGTSSSVLITKEASINTHTFTAAEMGSIGTGVGFVQITAYRIADTETNNGNKYYFINQKVNTISVNFN